MRYPPATITRSRPNDWNATPAPMPAAASTGRDDGCGGRFLRRRWPTTMEIAAPIMIVPSTMLTLGSAPRRPAAWTPRRPMIAAAAKTAVLPIR